MYKYCARQFPKLFDSMFNVTSSVHNYSTRNNVMFALPHCRTELRKKTIVYNGAHYYNHIVKNVSDIKTISSFKRFVKASIMDNVFDVDV